MKIRISRLCHKPARDCRSPWAVTIVAAALALVATALATRPTAARPLSAADQVVYRTAFAAVSAGRHDEAVVASQAAADRLLAKVVDWLRLIEGASRPSFEELSRFAGENPQWPGQSALTRRIETALTAESTDTILAFYRNRQPASADGVDALAGAMAARGDAAGARPIVRDYWIDNVIGRSREPDFLERHDGLLTQADHIARLDRLLWRGQGDAARRMFRLVPAGWRALAEARIALRALSSGVDGLIERVPAELSRDPGLAYERMRWRRRNDLDARAQEILLAPPAELGPEPRLWWRERHILVRRAMGRRDWGLAYRLAASHGQRDGFPELQAEWVSGFLALSGLGDPARAARHFRRLHERAETPISVARGAYWSGRAAEALGDTNGAAQWYAAAARHPITFYGQLAAQRLDPAAAVAPLANTVGDPASSERFEQSELALIARQLVQIGEIERASTFLARLGDTADSGDDFLLAAMLALDLGDTPRAIRISKQAAQDNVAVLATGYPALTGLTVTRPDRALVHGLIRQESLFDTDIVSRAGAVGLMQLMPATARAVARRLGVQHSEARLREPAHNVQLGTTYLAEMLERYDGSFVLATAAYNAGPGRADQWIREMGDPRDLPLDRVLDWIERIPIYETRNYVQRVLEGAQIYRAQLAGQPVPITLAQDLTR